MKGTRTLLRRLTGMLFLVAAACGGTSPPASPRNPFDPLYELRADVRTSLWAREAMVSNARLTLLELESASDRLGITHDEIIQLLRAPQSAGAKPPPTTSPTFCEFCARREVSDATQRLLDLYKRLVAFSEQGLGQRPVEWRQRLVRAKQEAIVSTSENAGDRFGDSYDAVRAMVEDTESEIARAEGRALTLQRDAARLVDEMKASFIGMQIASDTDARSPARDARPR
jgi:hypothetical protein